MLALSVHFTKFIMKFTKPESSTKFHEIYQARYLDELISLNFTSFQELAQGETVRGETHRRRGVTMGD